MSATSATSATAAPAAAPVPSLRKTLTVEASLERAFSVFTAKMSLWWPRQHHIGKAPLLECVIEPQVDGRWYEICEDGSTCQWGKVLVWEPPARLVLAWQLDAQFTYDPSLITEVDVRFTALGPKRTQVDFEHRNLERFGAGALPAAQLMDAGWGQILDAYVATALG